MQHVTSEAEFDMEREQAEDVLLDVSSERMSATALVTFNLKFVTSPNKWLGVTDSSGYKTICPSGKAGLANHQSYHSLV